MKNDKHSSDNETRTDRQHSEQQSNNGILKRRGANLPHWTKEGGWYSVTFRSYDSLPQSVLRSWRFERENIVRTAAKMNRPLSQHEQTRLRQLYSEKVEHYLDAGYGSCHMRDERIGSLVAESIQFFDGDRYDLAAWCVMPNHVHAVFRPLEGFDLDGILHSWKSFTSKEANNILGRRGTFWRSESYDRVIRNQREFEHAIRYVLQNPIKAGLQNWKWVGCGKGLPSMWPEEIVT